MTRTVAALLLFGISFGYLEAAVVVYLRAIYDPIRHRLHPGRGADELFPLISSAATGRCRTRESPPPADRDRPRSGDHSHAGSFGLALRAGIFNQRMAAFAVVFGFWDIFFYRVFKADDPLAAVAFHMGHFVPDSAAVGGPGVGRPLLWR